MEESEYLTLPLVPEITLHLPGSSLFYEFAGGPQWKTPWPGGQALARHILDNPEELAGQRVLDLGCGCGQVSVAAGMSGANVHAVDTNPGAVEACRENLQRMGLSGRVEHLESLDGFTTEVDLLLVAEMLYAEPLRRAVIPWLLEHLQRGSSLLISERGKVGLERLPVRPVAEHEVPGRGAGGDTRLYKAVIWRSQ